MGRGQRDATSAAVAPRRGTVDIQIGVRRPEINEELVMLELAAFLIGFDHWPTRQAFIDAGQGQLHQQAERTGGGERWAPEFGLTHVPERRDPEEEVLRAELADFLTGFDHWPTFTEFRTARRTTLRERVLKYGGTQRWATEFGLPTYREQQEARVQQRQAQRALQRRDPRRGRRDWTVETVRDELARFLEGSDHFPSEKEFREAGKRGLYLAAQRLGGADHWAAEFSLPRISDLNHRRTQELRAVQATMASVHRRDAERWIRELEEFCAGREYFPARSDWAAEGREDLKWFVQRNGGVHEWSRRLGLPLRPAQDRRPYGLDRALADGRTVIAEFGAIPNSSELQRAGHGKLWTYIRREFNGDRAAFAARCSG